MTRRTGRVPGSTSLGKRILHWASTSSWFLAIEQDTNYLSGKLFGRNGYADKLVYGDGLEHGDKGEIILRHLLPVFVSRLPIWFGVLICLGIVHDYYRRVAWCETIMKVLQDVGMTPGQDVYVHAAPNALNVATNQQQIQLKGFDISLPLWKFMEIWNPWNLEVLLSSQSFWKRTTAVMSMAGLLQAFFLPSFHYGRTPEYLNLFFQGLLLTPTYPYCNSRSTEPFPISHHP
jgi:hypothetical protein